MVSAANARDELGGHWIRPLVSGLQSRRS